MVYHDLRELELKNARIRLPAMISMKSEKAEEFLARSETEANPAEVLRRHWLINHFTVWYGTDIEGEPLVARVDRNGITHKSVDLPINLGADTLVTREVVAANMDYVQRRSSSSDSAKDRGAVPIDFPTRDFDLRVMVDLDLYGGNVDLREGSAINFSFRNSEGALCAHRNIDSIDNPITWSGDRYPDALYEDSEYKQDLIAVRESFRALQSRLSELIAPDAFAADEKPIVESHARERLGNIEMPREFLFGRLRWRMPYVGLQVCATWNKPDLRSADPNE